MMSERNSEKGFMNQKKKHEKSVSTETEYLTIENVEKVQSGNGRKAQPLSSVN